MEKEKFLECRSEILKTLEKFKAEEYQAAHIIAFALNEILAPNGHQAKIIIHPLLVYHEVENKI